MQHDPAKSLDSLDELLAELFGENKDRFVAAKPDMDDLAHLLENISDLYSGPELGEASAS